ncbi:MAG: phosphatidate cytidylyltransferase [Candidatus Competibacteraceae bacterium]|nr:MAG: phosphatidate cytidylyltransferase [Candidatus Competibacteraceae bacterium]
MQSASRSTVSISSLTMAATVAASAPIRSRSRLCCYCLQPALTLSRTAALLFFALVSFLALKEYLTLIPTRRADRRVLLWAYLSIPVQYFWIHIEWYGMFIIFIPVYLFLLLPVATVLSGERGTVGFSIGWIA